MQQFSTWFELTKESVDTHAPEGPAALQVRRAQGLVDYPTGKSAMVWYGYASTNARDVLNSVLAGALANGEEQHEFRWIEGSDQARETLEVVWAKFQRRFGSPPIFNQQ